MIISISAQKGGSGKSTLATNIAVCLSKTADVMLIDADRQPTATEWHAERKTAKKAINLQSVQKYGEIDDVLIDLNNRYAYVVVDCAGKDSVEMRSSMLCADIVITPARPSQADLNTLDVLTTIIRYAKRVNPRLRSYIVLTMCPTNPQINEIAEAKTFISDYPLLKMINQVIYDRKVYRDCLSLGLGVIESDNDKAAEEMRSLMQEVGYGD
jgi:chromosome partitioning protein